MKKPLHPLCVLAFVALPFIAYSVWRTGYSFSQLLDAHLLGTRYVWEVALLTSAVVTCCFRYEKKKKNIYSVASVVAVCAFFALQSAEDYPSDFKLWIFVVAPILTWSLALSSGFTFVLRKNEKRA